MHLKETCWRGDWGKKDTPFEISDFICGSGSFEESWLVWFWYVAMSRILEAETREDGREKLKERTEPYKSCRIVEERVCPHELKKKKKSIWVHCVVFFSFIKKKTPLLLLQRCESGNQCSCHVVRKPASWDLERSKWLSEGVCRFTFTPHRRTKLKLL